MIVLVPSQLMYQLRMWKTFQTKLRLNIAKLMQLHRARMLIVMCIYIYTV